MAYDTIVIGAGHNGLTAAATLAKAGQSVLVLEATDRIGGVAAAHEFHPGWRTAGLLADTTMVRPHVIDALGLQSHGLRLRSTPPDVLALGGQGSALRLGGDPERAAEAVARLDPRDGERYPQYVAFMRRIAPVIRDFFDRPAVDIVDVESESLWALAKRGLSVRRLGKTDMVALMRLPVMSVADVVGEWFGSDLLRATLCLPALAGTFTGPWSPGNAINLLRREALAGPGIVGGGPMLVAALHGAAQAMGVQVRTGACVAEIQIDATGVHGVVLADGERIESRRVLATCDPKTTLLRLVPAGTLAYRLEHHARTFRARGSVAHVAFAVTGEVRFGDTLPDSVAHVRTAACVDDLERAFDAIKYGELPPHPVLDIHVPSVADPSLAPAGAHVVTATVYFAPTDPRGGWTDAHREAVGDRAQAILAQHAPGIDARIVAREVLAPPDLAARYGVPDGELFHGEHSLDQLLVRPTPQCVHYRTPVPGLWLGGSGSHPGGGLTCGPGYLAAQTILAGA